MQTFLPYPRFTDTANVLDGARLGKQRVETLQILRAQTFVDYGWAAHPAVLMWRGFAPALVAYGRACVHSWQDRGHADGTLALIEEFVPGAPDQDDLAADGRLPPWLGDRRLHRSHQSALVRKDPDHYRQHFPAVPDDLPYWWPEPGPDGGPGSDQDRAGSRPLWVWRPPGRSVLGACLELGVVGLDASSGVDVDATGCDADSLRRLLAQRAPRRRPGKDLRQLAAFVAEVAPGDQVGLLVEEGRALLVGDVVGDYVFVGRTKALDLPHRRAVRWHGRRPREAVRPPALLQDPRRFFPVRTEPAPNGWWPPPRSARA